MVDLIVRSEAPLEFEETSQMMEALGIVMVLMSSVGLSYLLMLTVFKLIHLLQSKVAD